MLYFVLNYLLNIYAVCIVKRMFTVDHEILAMNVPVSYFLLIVLESDDFSCLKCFCLYLLFVVLFSQNPFRSM